MNRIRYCTITLFLLLASYGCTQPASYSLDAIEIEAQAFMDGYAQDLCCNDGAAITANYTRSGTYFVIQESKQLVPYDSIVTRYEWATANRDDPFQFHELTYEVLGPDAVVVMGNFIWADSVDLDKAWSYTGVLTREEGELRIRVENEAGSFWRSVNSLAKAEPEERNTGLKNIIGRMATIVGEAESGVSPQRGGLTVVKEVTDSLFDEAANQ